MRTKLLSTVLVLATATACRERAAAPPPPIMDVVSVPAGEFVGRVSTCPNLQAAESTILSEPDPLRDVRQRIEGFEIERYPVPCGDWIRCKRAGECPDRAGCEATELRNNLPRERFATVRFQDAKRLCAWRGGRLPTLPELQRALRGTTGLPEAPGWDVETRKTTCPQPADLGPGVGVRPCEQTSPDKVVYFTSAHAEWTSTITCGPHGHDKPGPTLMLVDSGHLSQLLTMHDPSGNGFVRCVRDGAKRSDATAPADRR